jgi:hypothetical protein
MTIWCDKETAVQIVESGNRVFVQGACATPTPLLEALVGRGEELHNVELTHLHTYGSTSYTDERWRGYFSLRALFAWLLSIHICLERTVIASCISRKSSVQ